MFSMVKFQPSGIVPTDGGLFGLDWSFVVDPQGIRRAFIRRLSGGWASGA
jgi:hypothetical protein